jgi:hypothetical protein
MSVNHEEISSPYDYYGDDYLDDEGCERDWPKCGCPYCFCSSETEHGEPCTDCEVGVHQG